jgi:hypothetical protein
MTKAWVTVTGFNADGYSKKLAVVSDQQIHMNDVRMRDALFQEADVPGAISFDPKQFPEVDVFVIKVELIEVSP